VVCYSVPGPISSVPDTTSFRDFFAAIAAIYVSCYLYRFGRTIYNSGIALFAYLTMLPSGPDHGLAHVRIVVPDRVSWKPGQHAYLRFWGLGFPHSFSSHPWTISSVCNTEGERAMEFVMRVHHGITARLARCAEGKVSFPIMVWVDGPYGEVPGGLDAYDHVLFLGGGSGTCRSSGLRSICA
jgi:predicted ferric reductase